MQSPLAASRCTSIILSVVAQTNKKIYNLRSYFFKIVLQKDCRILVPGLLVDKSPLHFCYLPATTSHASILEPLFLANQLSWNWCWNQCHTTVKDRVLKVFRTTHTPFNSTERLNSKPFSTAGSIFLRHLFLPSVWTISSSVLHPRHTHPNLSAISSNKSLH